MSKPTIDQFAYAGMDQIYQSRGGHVEAYRGKVEGHDTLIKIGAEERVKASLAREADILKKLEGSPHAPQLYDIGENEYGKTYLAMEFVRGEPLEEVIELDGNWNTIPLPSSMAARLTEKIATAEKDFLSKGVLYRDLNLKHIILSEETGEPVFIDYGLATTDSYVKDGKTIWRTHEHKGGSGTWELSSPEEFQPDAEIDETTSVYRLGVLYHMLLTGTPPVPRFNDLSQAKEWAKNPTFEFSTRLTSEGEALFAKALAPSSSERYQTIDEFLDDLRSLRKKTVTPPLAGIGKLPA